MMMRDLTQKDTLDQLLRDWHEWARGYSPIPKCAADPMFRQAKSGKGWDSMSDIISDELHGSTMQTIDAQVSELPDIPLIKPYRSAIYTIAKNLHAGATVWKHPRLPVDDLERGVVFMEARNMLTVRLINAGVM